MSYDVLMNYFETINESLKPQSATKWTALYLFAGCGGLLLGFEAAGFQTVGYELKKRYAETYVKNLNGVCYQQRLTATTHFDQTYDIVIGGRPCQPFSVGGNQKGINDERNGFPAFINAVRKVKPKLWLFENVRGMLYANKWYLEEVIQELEEEGYFIDYKLLNAVNYGVPQNRERLFVVGHNGAFHFPKPQLTKVTVGEAIGELVESTQDESKILTASMDQYVANYEKASSCINPRDLYMHKPARTLTCRNIAAPTGDMQRVKLADGRRRRISVREAARLQSFPDWFEFVGTETNQYYQIGNAVPPLLALHLAEAVRAYFESESIHNQPIIRPKKIIQKQLTLF